MKSKIELIHKSIIDIIATCGNIANANPRVKNVEKNPLTKQVRSFCRAFEVMEEDEIMEMAKIFYSKYYLTAIEDESISDWMTQNVELIYGDGDLTIKLRIGDYFRIATDIDSQLDDSSSKNPLSFMQEDSVQKKWSSTLRYDCLRLLMRLASPAIADKLDEKLQPLEKILGKTPMGTTSSSDKGGLPTGMGQLSTMFNKMIEGISKMGDNGGQLKEMMNNPQAKNVIDNVTKVFPPELQESMKQVMDDISSGQFDMSKTMNTLFSSMGGSLDDEPSESAASSSSSHGPQLIDFTEEVAHAGPSVLLSSHHAGPSVQSSDDGHCDDGVCYIQH